MFKKKFHTTKKCVDEKKKYWKNEVIKDEFVLTC